MFSINVPDEDIVAETGYTGLVGQQGRQVSPCSRSLRRTRRRPDDHPHPLTMECRLYRAWVPSHTLFIAEMVTIYTEERFLTDGKPDMGKISPFLHKTRCRRTPIGRWAAGWASTQDSGKKLLETQGSDQPGTEMNNASEQKNLTNGNNEEYHADTRLPGQRRRPDGAHQAGRLLTVRASEAVNTMTIGWSPSASSGSGHLHGGGARFAPHLHPDGTSRHLHRDRTGQQRAQQGRGLLRHQVRPGLRPKFKGMRPGDQTRPTDRLADHRYPRRALRVPDHKSAMDPACSARPWKTCTRRRTTTPCISVRSSPVTETK